jgi:hypothetical protein
MRVTTALPVRVWGVDANSRPFMQLATVRNISDKGILLDGLTCQLRAGAMVDIQYNGLKAEFLVVWAGKPGMPGEIGLQKMPTQPGIWDPYLYRATGLEATG